jgi:hypothetical protein
LDGDGVELSEGASASLSSLSSLSVDVMKSAGLQNVKGLPSETTARAMVGGPDLPVTNVCLDSIHLDVSSFSMSLLRERLSMFRVDGVVFGPTKFVQKDVCLPSITIKKPLNAHSWTKNDKVSCLQVPKDNFSLRFFGALTKISKMKKKFVPGTKETCSNSVTTGHENRGTAIFFRGCEQARRHETCQMLHSR